MRLRIGHQHSQFWPILARFVDYYSLFCGPGVISTIDESRGVFSCRLSTLTILADSGQFHGLSLIHLVSLNDFHESRIPGCVHVSDTNNRSFGRFWPVSWTITHHFGVPKRFPWLSKHTVRLPVGHQHSQFWPILARLVDYYSLF